MNIVLLNPEIHVNTGNIGRTCVLTNTKLHLIKPLGFELDDKKIQRAGLDYWKKLDLYVWESFHEFYEKNIKGTDSKIYMATTKTQQKYTDVKYTRDDFIMFGPESKGIPAEIREAFLKTNITIPMLPMGRSLNLSNSAAIIIYEAWRQLNFEF